MGEEYKQKHRFSERAKIALLNLGILCLSAVAFYLYPTQVAAAVPSLKVEVGCEPANAHATLVSYGQFGVLDMRATLTTTTGIVDHQEVIVNITPENEQMDLFTLWPGFTNPRQISADVFFTLTNGFVLTANTGRLCSSIRPTPTPVSSKTYLPLVTR